MERDTITEWDTCNGIHTEWDTYMEWDTHTEWDIHTEWDTHTEWGTSETYTDDLSGDWYL